VAVVAVKEECHLECHLEWVEECHLEWVEWVECLIWAE
jgi:hypothetical protein